ncbi:MAG: hypothetical protein OSJ58_07750 [Dysosmobacter sp.]|nr:hypothetical protein [Dysosmobacter sp.]
MNFSDFHHLDISGHRDIDFIDIRMETDTALYIDSERAALSNHPFSVSVSRCIDDFFSSLYDAALTQNELLLYRILSFGREPNETHLGLSTSRSCGKGTSPEILMPIIKDMIRMGLFERGLVTQLGDLHLWTPNFGYDRLSDLTTNIIRGVLYDYTLEQYKLWNIDLRGTRITTSAAWNLIAHRWEFREFPELISDGFRTLLVPKAFVGRSMLSSPGQLLQKYALSYRQREHLDERSNLCHKKTSGEGKEIWLPPTKKEIRTFEIKGRSEKAFLLEMGYRYPQMIHELHTDHKFADRRSQISISDSELDSILYGGEAAAI